MKLIFIHGWAFDASFWGELSAFLPQYEQQRMDLGFFAESSAEDIIAEKSILVGHSLGFVRGLNLTKNWAGIIAINSFPNFVEQTNRVGCVAPLALRSMRQKLGVNAQKTLDDFYRLTGAIPPQKPSVPNINRLKEGLDELRDVKDSNLMTMQNKPNLILAASNDPLVPQAVTESFSTVTANILWHDDGGHLLPRNDPAWCASAITGFMQKNFGHHQ